MSRMPSNMSLTVEEDALLRAFLMQGMPVAQVAMMLDLSPAVVALRRVQLGYHRVVVIWNDTMDATLHEMRAAGRSLRAIGKVLGVSRQAVYKRLVALGMRDRQRKPVAPDPMVAIVAQIARASTPYWVSDETQSVAIQSAQRALRALLNDPRIEIRLRDA